MQDLFSQAQGLLGKRPDDPALKAFLGSVGKWPVRPFADDETRIDLEDKARGYCLVFEAASVVKHAAAAGQAPDTAIFTGCFFYSEGTDEYHAYAGPLPGGVLWSDTASSLLAKLGPAQNEMKHLKTGQLVAHRWDMKTWLLTVRYLKAGAAVRHVYAGIV